jgi:hypothetical protein
LEIGKVDEALHIIFSFNVTALFPSNNIERNLLSRKLSEAQQHKEQIKTKTRVDINSFELLFCAQSDYAQTSAERGVGY